MEEEAIVGDSFFVFQSDGWEILYLRDSHPSDLICISMDGVSTMFWQGRLS